MENKPSKITPAAGSDSNGGLTFSVLNYALMLAGLVLLALGYVLLSGGGSDDPNVFNPEMFNSRRLFVAPVLIVLGFVVEIVAIMYKKK